MVEATVAYYMGGPGTPVLIFLLLSIFCSSPASMQILYQDFKVTGVFSLVAVEKKKVHKYDRQWKHERILLSCS